MAVVVQDSLRDTVDALCAIERGSATEGERAAAELIAERFRGAGLEPVVDEEPALGRGFWWPLGLMSLAGAAAGLAALRGQRALGALLGLAAGAGIADDLENGPRVFRRLVMPRRRTWNVTAVTGDPDASRTVVVLAHHDAPYSGLVFSQDLQRLVDEHTGLVERTDTAVPVFFPVVAGPLLVALGSVLRRAGLVRAGTVLATGSVAAFADIAARGPVPAANDNASGVACLVALAERLRDEPVSGVRVVLASCGSEESFQQGVRAWARRWFPRLPRDRTWVLNMETVGSPELALLEGEGTLHMQDYQAGFKDQVDAWAREVGIPLRRKLRSRTSTDAVIPHRAGYPTANFVSVTRWKALANYHWPSDVPENVDFGTVAQATEVAATVIRRLASEAT
ncbi:MAG: M28 family metallopeptidase [Gaiellaceae bacterium]